MLRLGLVTASALVSVLGACGDDEGDGASDQGTGAAPSTTVGSGGSGGSGAMGPASTSAMSSSSTGGCTMGGEPGCPCPNDVCPEVLVADLDFASSLRQTSTDLFYIASIDRLPKAGGMPTKVVSDIIGALAVDEAGLYFIDGTATFVKTAAHDGSGVQNLASADASMHPQFVVVDDTYAFFATVAAQGSGSCVRIQRAPKIGGGPTEQMVEVCDSSTQRIPFGLAIDDTKVYFATVTSPALQMGKIHSADKAGGGPIADLVSANGPIKNLSVHGGRLYFVAGGAVNVYDLAGGGSADKISGQTAVSAYAVDGDSIWAVGDQGLYSIDPSTETGTMLAWERGSEIVVDASKIYWLSSSGGKTSILALPR